MVQAARGLLRCTQAAGVRSSYLRVQSTSGVLCPLFALRVGRVLAAKLAPDDVCIVQVDVDRMVPSSATIDQNPNVKRALLYPLSSRPSAGASCQQQQHPQKQAGPRNKQASWDLLVWLRPFRRRTRPLCEFNNGRQMYPCVPHRDCYERGRERDKRQKGSKRNITYRRVSHCTRGDLQCEGRCQYASKFLDARLPKCGR